MRAAPLAGSPPALPANALLNPPEGKPAATRSGSWWRSTPAALELGNLVEIELGFSLAEGMRPVAASRVGGRPPSSGEDFLGRDDGHDLRIRRWADISGHYVLVSRHNGAMIRTTGTRVLSVDQVGLATGFTGKTVRRWIHREGLPAVKLGESRQAPLRVDADELEAWLEARHLSKGQNQ